MNFSSNPAIIAGHFITRYYALLQPEIGTK